MKLSEKIVELRKANGMTQQEVADRLHIHRTTYTKYETRNVQPSFEHLFLLAKILRVSVDDLLRCPELDEVVPSE